MITVGIISEYNPFHKGHERQIKAIRDHFAEEDVTVIALMSGNFVERGDLAVFPKGYRAKSALLGGADLVLEYPYPFSGAGAEAFARGGVSLLTALGVDCLSFGSEKGDLALLNREAKRLMSDEFETALAETLSQTRHSAYAAMREETYQKLYGESLATQANDILGVAYLMAMTAENSLMKPLVIKREGMETATASRRAVFNKNSEELSILVPQYSCDIATKCQPIGFSAMDQVLVAFLRLQQAEAFRTIADLPFDLACRILEAAYRTDDIEALIEQSIGKTYTRARIRRALLSMLFGVTKEQLAKKPLFTRLLAANEKGRLFLAKTDFPILTRLGDAKSFGDDVKKQVAFADRCDAVYRLFDKNPPINKPFIL